MDEMVLEIILTITYETKVSANKVFLILCRICPGEKENVLIIVHPCADALLLIQPPSAPGYIGREICPTICVFWYFSSHSLEVCNFWYDMY